METCIVVEHLPRLSASQSRNGTTEENGDKSPEKRKAFDNKVTIKFILQCNPEFVDSTYLTHYMKCLCHEIYVS